MKNGIASSEKLAHAAGDLQHHGFERHADPERTEDGGEAERIGHRHAEQADDAESSEQDEDVHDASP